MVSGCVIEIVFGALLGLGIASRTDETSYMYLYGKWSFVGEKQRTKAWNFFRKLLVELLLAGPPIIITILGVLLPKNYYVRYFLASLGIWLAAILLISLSNRMLLRFNII